MTRFKGRDKVRTWGLTLAKRREFIIAPMLIEMRQRAGTVVSILPGVAFDVDKGQWLVGFCPG